MSGNNYCQEAHGFKILEAALQNGLILLNMRCSVFRVLPTQMLSSRERTVRKSVFLYSSEQLQAPGIQDRTYCFSRVSGYVGMVVPLVEAWKESTFGSCRVILQALDCCWTSNCRTLPSASLGLILVATCCGHTAGCAHISEGCEYAARIHRKIEARGAHPVSSLSQLDAHASYLPHASPNRGSFSVGIRT